MSVKVVTFNVAIVVLPIFSPCVIRWVYIDAVDLASIGEQKRLEGMVIFSVDDCVVRLVAAAPDLAG